MFTFPKQAVRQRRDGIFVIREVEDQVNQCPGLVQHIRRSSPEVSRRSMCCIASSHSARGLNGPAGLHGHTMRLCLCFPIVHALNTEEQARSMPCKLLPQTFVEHALMISSSASISRHDRCILQRFWYGIAGESRRVPVIA